MRLNRDWYFWCFVLCWYAICYDGCGIPRRGHIYKLKKILSVCWLINQQTLFLWRNINQETPLSYTYLYHFTVKLL